MIDVNENELQPEDKLVSGRRLWLQAFDKVLAKSENIRAFADAIQTRIDTDPLVVWERDVKPLLGSLLKAEEETAENTQQLTIVFKPKGEKHE
jgi:hypothetical protein